MVVNRPSRARIVIAADQPALLLERVRYESGRVHRLCMMLPSGTREPLLSEEQLTPKVGNKQE